MIERQLTLLNAEATERPWTCGGVAGGLSLEEVELARQALALKLELRRARAAGDAGVEELARLRQHWTVLVNERQRAWRRKMVALGHFPVDTAGV